MRNVERIDGASYTPTARILLQNIDVRAEIISEKKGGGTRKKYSAHAVRTTLKR